MTDDKDDTSSSDIGFRGRKPALQVICLGSGGGPSEENVTGLLVRSIASDWTRGSLLAVDAGSHLAPIVKILERDFPLVSSIEEPAGSTDNPRTPPSPDDDAEVAKPEPTILNSGPFAGLKLPNSSARANALHILRSYVNTYLVTHPHLDHLSGFTINTAAFHATSRPKTVAALPSTIEAIKNHIFNDVIWPNLSDEDGGVGFVTFQRLKEGGDVMVGEGEGRGYIEVSDGLSVKPFKVSHGVCTKGPPSHHHRGSVPNIHEQSQPPYHGSHVGEPAPSLPRNVSMSGTGQYSTPGTPRTSFFSNSLPSPRLGPADYSGRSCVVDSTAYFVRDIESNREVLIFGDVEPDSLSLTPRTYLVWQEAARKIAHGLLGGIFIESSYDDSQADAILFGHLNPKHLIIELQNLAAMVVDAKAARNVEMGAKKRKRSGPNGLDVVAKHAVRENEHKRSRSLAGRSVLVQDRRRSSVPDHTMDDAPIAASPLSPMDATVHPKNDRRDPIQHPREHDNAISPKAVRLSVSTTNDTEFATLPLEGLKVVIIHIKDTMKDGPHVRDNILVQLQQHEETLREEGKGLGCEFVISGDGESYWF